MNTDLTPEEIKTYDEIHKQIRDDEAKNGDARSLLPASRGYALAEELRKEADDVATPYRARLMVRAAEEIEQLIMQVREKAHTETKLSYRRSGHGSCGKAAGGEGGREQLP